jgi:CSLREA domain-containing protein
MLEEVAMPARLFIVALAAALFAFLAPSPAAYGANINPTVFTDDFTVNGNCTLREAIAAANLDTAVDACPAGSGGDNIQLGAGTYTLSLVEDGILGTEDGDMRIYTSMSIAGAGFDQTTVDGASIDGVFTVQVGPVRFSQLTVTGGSRRPDQAGAGAIWNLFDSDTQLNDVTVTGNINNAAVQNNGTMRIFDSNIAGNGTSGIFNGSGTLLIEDSAVQLNEGPGIFNRAEMTVRRSFIANNAGDGFVNDLEPGDATLENVTISGNADGGVHQTGGATSSLSYVTIADNVDDDSPLRNDSGAIEIANSIIQGPTGSSPSCLGDITSLGHNIIERGSCGTPAEGDQPDTEAAIGPLANNLGFTFTHALMEDSPAIDGASGDCPAVDQRNLPRPQGLACDVGAYESDFAPPDPLTQGDLNCDGTVDMDDFDLMLRYAADFHAGITPGACPNIGFPEPISGRGWGDVSCDDAENALDALYLIAHQADISLPLPAECHAVGEAIE